MMHRRLATLVACATTITAVALAGSSDCCESSTGSAGCGDAACEAAVCAMDPYCCLVEWDRMCAEAAHVACGAVCPCNVERPADLDFSGSVGGSDLGMLLEAWGTASPCADLNDNGVVGPADLGILLGQWGS